MERGLPCRVDRSDDSSSALADRFEQTEHSELALNIEDCLSDIRDNRGRLSSSTISTLSQLIYRLARTGLRHSDPHNQSFLPPLSKPVYIALQDRSAPSIWYASWTSSACPHRLSAMSPRSARRCIAGTRPPS